MQYTYQPVTPYAQPPRRKNGHKPIFLFLLSAGITFAVLGLALLGVMLYQGSQYGQALACLERQDYAGTQQKLTSVASFYKDTEKLKVYARAGIALTAGKYDEARSLFGSLQGFRDSKDMIKEAYYRQAKEYFDQSKYESALDMMLTLDPYKDSASTIGECVDKILYEATGYYKGDKYAEAKEKFTKIKDINKDAAKYLILIEAHGKKQKDCSSDYAEMKSLYGQLTEISSFGDAQELRNSDAFFLFRLEGNWEMETGSPVIDIYFNEESDTWYMHESKIDGVESKLEDRCLYCMVNGTWDLLVKFKFSSDDSLTLSMKYDYDFVDLKYKRVR